MTCLSVAGDNDAALETARSIFDATGQTLVIDEGFGTHDEQGLTHLIEAIQAISDEFEKVLVITHVETIKNAFPIRIEVVKHPESGSTFNVVN